MSQVVDERKCRARVGSVGARSSALKFRSEAGVFDPGVVFLPLSGAETHRSVMVR